MELKLAEKSMLPELAELERVSFSDPWTESMLEAELDTDFSRFYVAVEEGRVLGFCILRLVFGEGEIFNIAVHPDKRGLGLGEKLLRHALVSAAGEADCVFLEVREGNIPARHLYEKLGFEMTGRRSGYYLNPREDAILMTFRYEKGKMEC